MAAVMDCAVVTDDRVGPAALASRYPPGLPPAIIERIHGPACDVLLVMTPDLATAVSLLRGAEERGRHARLHVDAASARAFAEALTAGRVSWEDR